MQETDPKILQIIENIEDLDLDDDCTVSNAYYTVSEINELQNSEKSLSVFHVNTAYLGFYFDQVYEILSNSTVNYDFIGISETRIKRYATPTQNTEIPNYEHVDCETESTKGGVRLYISDKHNFRERNDLKMYKAKELESVFVEIQDKINGNLIVGCIYRHPCMEDIDEFNTFYLTPLLEKISSEKKKVILMGDFNINLLNYDSQNETNDFLNLMQSNSLIPLVLKPTRITTRTKTLIDNIFTNLIDIPHVSGNITYKIADHLPQFAIFEQRNRKKIQIEPFEIRNYAKFNQDDFLTDFIATDWYKLCSMQLNNPDLSLHIFLTKITELINKHAPLIKIKPKRNSMKKKPWITAALLTSINHKQELYKKMIKRKNSETRKVINEE